MEAGQAHPVEGVTYSYAPSPKVVGWKNIFAAMPDLLDRYQRIALLDDDLDTDASTLSHCFDIGAEHDLLIWQPSLRWDSYTTFAGLLQNPAFFDPLCQLHRNDVPPFSRARISNNACRC
jgi:hypothetical protein